ncbi:MAG: OFA family MFS transporter [Clostridium sp.]|uniref:OFA family MFS transporter n=1 Tax=Clostridium sp. TaxID=1506 RepID=UPI003F3D2103
MKKSEQILILIGAVITQLGLGTFYTWSLANKPLALAHGWDVKQVVISFSIASLFLAIGTLLAKKLQFTFGLKKVIIACGIIFCITLIIAPLMNSLPLLYIFAGVILGLCDGVAYVLTVSNVIKWFPKHKGLVSGISVGAYGVGSLIFTSINSYLFKHFEVHIAFLIWGVLAGILIIVGAIITREAILSILPDKNHKQTKVYSVKDLLGTKQTYFLFIAFFGSCATGLYLIGSATTIAINLGHMTVATAALAVSIIAIFNTLGRIIYGFISDKLGINIAATILFVLMIIALLVLLFIKITFPVFLIALILIAACFGGGFTIYPSIVGEYYGLRNHSMNYGIIYQCFGVAGIFTGVVGGLVPSYKYMFGILLAFCVLSLVIMIFIREPKKNALSK